MAAAWVMAIDFTPPKLAVVIAEGTHTRKLVAASGELTVSLPTVALADLTWTVGSRSGAEVDKLETYGIATSRGAAVGAPLVDGCVGWLECKVIPEPHVQSAYDLFVVEVVAAWYDDRVFDGREWDFSRHPELRTIHHLGRGVFYATGERVEGRELEPGRP